MTIVASASAAALVLGATAWPALANHELAQTNASQKDAVALVAESVCKGGLASGGRCQARP